MDVYALIIAIASLWIAIYVARRDYSIDVRVFKCVQQSTHGAKGESVSFELFVRNKGISLYNVSAALTFTEASGASLFEFPLQRSGPYESGYAEFARGMVATFKIDSRTLESSSRSFLSVLKDAKRQRARIVFFSQGYTAKTVRTVPRLRHPKNVWNQFATWIMMKTPRQIGVDAEGNPIMRYLELPRFVRIDVHLMRFVRAVSPKEPEKAADVDSENVQSAGELGTTDDGTVA